MEQYIKRFIGFDTKISTYSTSYCEKYLIVKTSSPGDDIQKQNFVAELKPNIHLFNIENVEKPYLIKSKTITFNLFSIHFSYNSKYIIMENIKDFYIRIIHLHTFEYYDLKNVLFSRNFAVFCITPDLKLYILSRNDESEKVIKVYQLNGNPVKTLKGKKITEIDLSKYDIKKYKKTLFQKPIYHKGNWWVPFSYHATKVDLTYEIPYTKMITHCIDESILEMYHNHNIERPINKSNICLTYFRFLPYIDNTNDDRESDDISIGSDISGDDVPLRYFIKFRFLTSFNKIYAINRFTTNVYEVEILDKPNQHNDIFIVKYETEMRIKQKSRYYPVVITNIKIDGLKYGIPNNEIVVMLCRDRKFKYNLQYFWGGEMKYKLKMGSHTMYSVLRTSGKALKIDWKDKTEFEMVPAYNEYLDTLVKPLREKLLPEDIIYDIMAML